MSKVFLLLVAAVFVCPAGVAVWQWRWSLLEQSQDEPIHAAALRYEVDPALIKAVVWRESRFDAEARGGAGELGLMQLREIAAREWADAEQVTEFRHPHCLDPVTNTLAGTYYLKTLLERYRHTDDPVPYALADYNAGRSRVRQWLGGAAATNATRFVGQIGFPSTRRYVLQVMRQAHRYAATPPLLSLGSPGDGDTAGQSRVMAISEH